MLKTSKLNHVANYIILKYFFSAVLPNILPHKLDILEVLSLNGLVNLWPLWSPLQTDLQQLLPNLLASQFGPKVCDEICYLPNEGI